jgi:hypothetical protein
MAHTYVILRKTFSDRVERPVVSFLSRGRAEEVLRGFLGLIDTKNNKARRMQNAGIPPSPTASGLTKEAAEARKGPHDLWWETYRKIWSDSDRAARALGDPDFLADDYRMVEVPLHE